MRKENDDDLPEVEEELVGGDEWASMITDGDHQAMSAELDALTQQFLAQRGKITQVADGAHVLEPGSKSHWEAAQKSIAKKHERRHSHEESKIYQLLRMNPTPTLDELRVCTGKTIQPLVKLLRERFNDNDHIRGILAARSANKRGVAKA